MEIVSGWMETFQDKMNRKNLSNSRISYNLHSLHKLRKTLPMFKLSKGIPSKHKGNTIEEKPEEAEYWLARISQIVIKQLSCSDEHKLECVVPLLADEALSWWETMMFTASPEKITWKFFVEEFKKKYTNEQYLNDQKDKCRKFTDGLNDELGPMFTAMEIEDFQILVNQVTATEAKMKATERRNGGNRNNKKQKRDDRS
ncbi:hypothetical protein V6N12_033006 [Hibiscus sabdariffa]|uniref:Retrotransposon gag domain-containing protein n=1 Tax=Hibiscus sabdariffa TaxID=183260 RepID=A0ABR2CER4_9ROSI